VFPRLLQINTIAGAIQRYFPLFATALCANPPMHRWTEALFLADATDGTGQRVSPFGIMSWRPQAQGCTARIAQSWQFAPKAHFYWFLSLAIAD
jgi:hypothetical protein